MDFSHAMKHYGGRLIDDGWIIKAQVAAVVTIANRAGAAWALVPVLYQIAIALLIFDWITGTAKAYLLKTNNSDAGKKGVVKSAFYLGFLVLAEQGGRMAAEAAKVAPPELAWIAIISAWLPVYAFVSVGHTETTSSLENFRDIATHFGVTLKPLDGAIALLRINTVESMTDAIRATIATVIPKQTGELPANPAPVASTPAEPKREGGPDA